MNTKTEFACPNCGKINEINNCYVRRKIAKNHRLIFFCDRKCKNEDFFKRTEEKIDREDIIKMYCVDMLGVSTITKKYDVTQKVIENILKENNIEMRDKTWVLSNRPPFKGYKRSKEQKEEASRKSKEAYKNSPELRNISRQTMLKTIKEGKMPKMNTSIEKIMTGLLIDSNIKFEYQKIFAFWAYDFYLPDYNLFIECDGDYWHAHPDKYKKEDLNATQKNNLKRGKQKETYVTNRGYRLIRFWEQDINNNIEGVKKVLYEAVGKERQPQ